MLKRFLNNYRCRTLTWKSLTAIGFHQCSNIAIRDNHGWDMPTCFKEGLQQKGGSLYVKLMSHEKYSLLPFNLCYQFSIPLDTELFTTTAFFKILNGL